MTMTPPPKAQSEWILGIERFIIFTIVAFASQVTIAGQALDLSSATGRAAAVSAILSALYVVGRKQLFGN